MFFLFVPYLLLRFATVYLFVTLNFSFLIFDLSKFHCRIYHPYHVWISVSACFSVLSVILWSLSPFKICCQSLHILILRICVPLGVVGMPSLWLFFLHLLFGIWKSLFSSLILFVFKWCLCGLVQWPLLQCKSRGVFRWRPGYPGRCSHVGRESRVTPKLGLVDLPVCHWGMGMILLLV